MGLAACLCLPPPAPQVDRLFQWDSKPNGPIQDALARQSRHTLDEFETRLAEMTLQLNEQARRAGCGGCGACSRRAG